MASALQEAKERFELAQEALERFTQENIRITLAGSEFISTGNVDQLSRRLAALRAEYDRSGQEWYEVLEANKVMQ